ncbi:low molecular weight phosphotyrosine protein phosphatase [Motiliproteus coralliicola]|uniref:protein-tyrosine-phosphatase n=1 Tax=Motiliproteus coralliicola TaxID=2283196 RepID=A0A369WW57_9GAMM|nr:low molecular weight protein-tyrosine-phosphatase [Motiliproteus coralliicola]RDE24776.1 low molecular weight phosphotyrosine protein phosphatase [Motiliproteus coralliicola]
MQSRYSVLFVCLGNICRSPTAHGVFQHLVSQQGLSGIVEVDSAGTAAFHVGAKPDHRSIKVASERGYDLKRLRARKVQSEDFHRYDYILAMDNENLRNLQEIMPDNPKARLQLFLEHSEQQRFSEVPDPYYGGARGFDLVLDLIEDASGGLLREIHQRLQQD